LPLAGDRKPFPFRASVNDERFAQFSPDGHWVAYAASEFGRPDVYVAPFPGPGGKQQISMLAGAILAGGRTGRNSSITPSTTG
jgi:Tol biopolymer transport system component